MAELNVAALKYKKACPEQLNLFISKYGEMVNITVKECIKEHDKFAWVWASVMLLTAPAKQIYNKERFEFTSKTRARAFALAYNSKENKLKRDKFNK